MSDTLTVRSTSFSTTAPYFTTTPSSPRLRTGSASSTDSNPFRETSHPDPPELIEHNRLRGRNGYATSILQYALYPHCFDYDGPGLPWTTFPHTHKEYEAICQFPEPLSRYYLRIWTWQILQMRSWDAARRREESAIPEEKLPEYYWKHDLNRIYPPPHHHAACTCGCNELAADRNRQYQQQSEGPDPSSSEAQRTHVTSVRRLCLQPQADDELPSLTAANTHGRNEPVEQEQNHQMQLGPPAPSPQWPVQQPPLPSARSLPPPPPPAIDELPGLTTTTTTNDESPRNSITTDPTIINNSMQASSNQHHGQQVEADSDVVEDEDQELDRSSDPDRLDKDLTAEIEAYIGMPLYRAMGESARLGRLSAQVPRANVMDPAVAGSRRSWDRPLMFIESGRRMLDAGDEDWVVE